MNPLARAAAHLHAALIDNPVLEKDALSQLRATRAIIQVALGVAVCALVGIGAVAAPEAMVERARQYGLFEPTGRVLFALVLGGALGVVSLMLPLLGSMAIAAERERGTLPLITGSALSPVDIALGKVLGVLAASAPYFLPALVLLPLANVTGDVPVAAVLGGLVALAWHAVAMAAVGVAVSASAERVRTASPQALVIGLVVSAVGALPLVVAAGVYAASEDPGVVLPVAALGVCIESLVAWLAFAHARAVLSPPTTQRWPMRRAPLLLLLTSLPILAAVLAHLVPGGVDQDEVAVLLHVEAAFVVLFGVLGEVAIADRARVDGRDPARVALMLSGAVALSVALAHLVPMPEGLDDADPVLSTLEWPSLIVLVGSLAFYALVVAAIGRVVKTPALRLGLAFGVMLAILIAPVVLHELRSIIDLGALTFMWLHPVEALDQLERTGNWDRAMPALAFYVVAPLALFALARRRT